MGKHPRHATTLHYDNKIEALVPDALDCNSDVQSSEKTWYCATCTIQGNAERILDQCNDSNETAQKQLSQKWMPTNYRKDPEGTDRESYLFDNFNVSTQNKTRVRYK